MNLVFALLFSILYFLTALGLVALGKEAPIFATFGLGYLVVSLAVLWGGYFFLERRRPRHPRLIFFCLGLVVFGSVFPLFYATEAYDNYRDHRKLDDFRRTDVFDLSDELFVTQRGNPLGIRLHYSVRVPRTGRYSPSPRLVPQAEALRGSRALLIYQLDVVPRPKPLYRSDLRVPYGRYQAGRVYRFTADVIPAYVVPSADRSGFCISFAVPEEKSLADAEVETRFLVDIDGTAMSRHTTGRPGLTRNAYAPKLFYQGALAEGADRPCRFDSRGNLP